MTLTTPAKLHWNYFLALERDLDVVSRYVEFTPENFSVYSIELAHLLFAAASEVDVLAKLICEIVSPCSPRSNINDYRSTLVTAIPDLPNAEVIVLRYGLVLTPWDSWSTSTNPAWWRSHNDVKHERDTYFNQATLENALNAMSALLLFNYHYYSRKLAPSGEVLRPKDVTRHLFPESGLLRLNGDFYNHYLVT